MSYQECTETLIIPFQSLLRDVEAIDDKIQLDKTIALSLVEEETQQEQASVPMSGVSSGVTQDPGVEPGSRLNPDMAHYGYDPTDEELLAEGIQRDQAIYEKLEELLRESQEPKRMREATIWFQESGRKKSIFPPDLWKMSLCDETQKGSWEIGLYRITQCMGLIAGIPNKTLSMVLNKGFWEMVNLYGTLVNQVGGRWSLQVQPVHHYGLKALDAHAAPEAAQKAASLLEASESWAS